MHNPLHLGLFPPAGYPQELQEPREQMSLPETTMAENAGNGSSVPGSWQSNQFEAEPQAPSEAVRSNSAGRTTGTTSGTGFELPPMRLPPYFPTTRLYDRIEHLSTTSSNSSTTSLLAEARTASYRATNINTASRTSVTANERHLSSVDTDNEHISDWPRNAMLGADDHLVDAYFNGLDLGRLEGRLEASLDRQFDNGSPSQREELRREIRRRIAGMNVNCGGASKSAMDALVKVPIHEIKENDRMCQICYNDYGNPNLEGIIEIPLRLPKCKHTFGDVCLKKWLEEKNTCPYCRDTLPSNRGAKEQRILDDSRRMSGIRERHNPTERTRSTPDETTLGRRPDNHQLMSRHHEPSSHSHNHRSMFSRRARGRTSSGRATQPGDHGRSSASSMRSATLAENIPPYMPMRTPIGSTTYGSFDNTDGRGYDYNVPSMTGAYSARQGPPQYPGFFTDMREADYPAHNLASPPVWQSGYDAGTHPAPNPTLPNLYAPSYSQLYSTTGYDGRLIGSGYPGDMGQRQMSNYDLNPNNRRADSFYGLEARGERNTLERLAANRIPPTQSLLQNNPLSQTPSYTPNSPGLLPNPLSQLPPHTNSQDQEEQQDPPYRR